jgi:VanZ family protein
VGCFRERERAVDALLVCVLLATVAGMLYFGVRPKGYRPGNNAQWLREGPGISFDRFGVAHSGLVDFAALEEGGFSVVFAIRPEISGRPDFRFFMVAHDGDDARQLVIGQWRSWIVAMNGDDYDARRKTRRISVDLAQSETVAWVAFTSGDEGTRVYLNGRLHRTDPLLRLAWPNAGGSARLVLGNSIYGRHPWRGELRGLAVFGQVLDEERVGALFQEWRDAGKFAFDARSGLHMLFPLVEGAGEIAHDRSGNGIHIEIPARMRMLQKEFLVLWYQVENKKDFVLDVVLNFFGFWPLGFVLAATLNRGRWFNKYSWQAAILFCFVFSFSLETAQVWMPSRHSHLLDLVLNTAGGAAGVGVYAAARRKLGFSG